MIDGVLAGGRDVLLVGPAQPDDFDSTPLARYPVRCAYLDCADETLAERLRARGVPDEEVADELASAALLRRSIHAPVRTDGQTPEQIAAGVAAWIGATAG